MKNLPYRLIIEVIGIILIILLFFYLHRLNLDYKRMKNNYTTSHNTPDKQDNEYLTKQEFKKYYTSELDTFKKYIKGIKVKNLQNITKVYNYYIDSSLTIYTAKQLNDTIYDISYYDKCFGFSGTFNTDNKIVNITNKSFSNNFEIVDYYLRKKLFGVNFFPRWSFKKEYFRKTFSDCADDSIIVKKINLIKIKDLNNLKF